MRRLLLAITGLALGSAFAVQAQGADTLRDTIAAQDQAMFGAYNACDLDTFREYIDENIEFYQDNDDVTTSRAALEVAFKHHCGPGDVARQRRELVPGTLEVHPIQGYGAVEMGAHRFCEVDSDGRPRKCATPRFVHLWHNDDGHWRITRVISYGH